MDLQFRIPLASRQSIPDELANIIMTKIFRDEIHAGYVFPNEITLCRELDISRNSLREAYKILESRGFVERSKRGTIVSDRDSYVKKMPIGFIFRFVEHVKLYEYREMLECGVVKYAVKKATQENINIMQNCIAGMITNKEHPRERMEFDVRFHSEIGKATQNEMFSAMYKPIEDFLLSDVYMTSMYDRIISNTERAVGHHTNILNAIIARDIDAAQSAMASHIQDTTMLVDKT